MKIITTEEFQKHARERRTSGKDQQVDERAEAIIEQVKRDEDDALFELTKTLDGVWLDNLAVSDEEMKEAESHVSDEFMTALTQARDNIAAFHKRQTEASWSIEQSNASWLGQKVTPISKAGIYIPGGKAAYPSTVLMNAVPANIAGVEDIIITTPPRQDGSIAPEVLVAAELTGVTEIYKTGGAQAIAALAYGTETIPSVYKIVGPGNAYVASAKKQVFGDVAIDMIAGPSEICVVADATAIPSFAAADLLSQAEHDEEAAAICITTSSQQAESIKDEIDKQIIHLERRAIIEQSLEQNGAIIVAESMDDVFDIVNDLAPEHLELMVDEPYTYIDSVHNAGSIFLGNYSPEPLGDYFAGPNHTLPTSESAKFSSPLGVYDFLKRSSITYYSREALVQSADMISLLAESEHLGAHARAVQIRKEADDETNQSKS